ncbi:MAG: glutathione binding-like protein [Spongiibacteraceae bacterium]
MVTNDDNALVTIYHIEGRRSERVAWLCEELGIPYKLVFNVGDLKGSMQNIKSVSSMGVAPTVRIDNQIIVESGAILQYIQMKYAGGRLAPPVGSPDFPYHLQWLHYSEGSAMYRIVAESLLRQIDGQFKPTPLTQLHMSGAARTLAFMEEFLSQHSYFGGEEFSSADIMMHFPTKVVSIFTPQKLEDYPHVLAWRKKVEARPAFLRTMKATLPNGPTGNI